MRALLKTLLNIPITNDWRTFAMPRAKVLFLFTLNLVCRCFVNITRFKKNSNSIRNLNKITEF